MADRTCSVPKCEQRPIARGWCARHYQRWQRYGDPLVQAQIQGDDEARFWLKVTAAGPDGMDCWLWTDARDKDGYGKFRLGRASKRSHRVAWELLRGDIPNDPKTDESLVLDHLCRNRACVNPWHLDPVTNLVNVRRGEALSEDACRRGHPRTAMNTGITPRGIRYCKDCKREDAVLRGARRSRLRPVTARAVTRWPSSTSSRRSWSRVSARVSPATAPTRPGSGP